MTNIKKSELKMVAGSTAEVSLQRYAGSGYLWKLVGGPVPSGIVSVEIVALGDNRNGGIGGIAGEVLRIRANLPGHYELRIELGRPWEADPIEEMHLILTVE